MGVARVSTAAARKEESAEDDEAEVEAAERGSLPPDDVVDTCTASRSAPARPAREGEAAGLLFGDPGRAAALRGEDAEVDVDADVPVAAPAAAFAATSDSMLSPGP